MNAKNAASEFVTWAICDWGQTEDARIAAVQDALDCAGFNATATCGPVFGGIWPRSCDGPDGEIAATWLKKLTDTMQRGKFEREVEHVEQMITARLA